MGTVLRLRYLLLVVLLLLAMRLLLVVLAVCEELVRIANCSVYCCIQSFPSLDRLLQIVHDCGILAAQKRRECIDQEEMGEFQGIEGTKCCHSRPDNGLPMLRLKRTILGQLRRWHCTRENMNHLISARTFAILHLSDCERDLHYVELKRQLVQIEDISDGMGSWPMRQTSCLAIPRPSRRFIVSGLDFFLRLVFLFIFI